jgi:hypothetical protein
MPDPHDTAYRERLMPTPWMYIFIALVIPATLLVFLPISAPVGIAVAVLLYGAAIGLLIYTAPVIAVSDGELRAGRAHIPVSLLGAPAAFTDEEATLERGRRLDARAHLCIRGWVKPVVRVPVTDPADPAPYWLVSTRTPEKLIAAIEGSQRLVESA